MLNMSGTGVVGLDRYGSDAQLAAVELFKDYPEKLLHIAAACCLLFMLVGIPGNLITIISLARYKKIQNATALFIINLSCSDLLFCSLILPLNISVFLRRSWTYGKVLCRLYPLINYGLTATSILTIILITVNRYVIVVHPEVYPKLYQKRNILLMVICVWVCGFGVLMPTFFGIWGRYSMNSSVGFCTVIPDERNRSPKIFFVVMAFATPSIFMVFCYARILWVVKKSERKSKTTPRHEASSSSDLDNGKGPNIFPRQQSSMSDCSTREESETKLSNNKAHVSNAVRIIRSNLNATFKRAQRPRPIGPTNKDKRLRTLILAIIFTFFTCHLPIMVAKTMSNKPFANITGYMLIYLTTCINPVVYVVMSREYRQAYKKLFCR